MQKDRKANGNGCQFAAVQPFFWVEIFPDGNILATAIFTIATARWAHFIFFDRCRIAALQAAEYSAFDTQGDALG